MIEETNYKNSNIQIQVAGSSFQVYTSKGFLYQEKAPRCYSFLFSSQNNNKIYQEGLNLVHPLEPDLSGINETVRERVSVTTPKIINGFQEWNTQPPAFFKETEKGKRASRYLF